MLIVQRVQVAAIHSRMYNHGVRVHNQSRRLVVDEIIGRLPYLTGAQLGRLEDESGASASAGFHLLAGERALPVSRRLLRHPSRRSWSTVPTRTAICSWSYAATSVATVPPASVDPTGTSSTTSAASARSSTSARLTTRRSPWPPSGQSPRGCRLLLREALHMGVEATRQ